MPKPNHLRYCRLAAACALALSAFAMPSYVLADEGIVRGELRSASSNTTLEGARVRLMEAGRETYTNANGRFQFRDVAPGEYTLVVDYIGMGETREIVTVEEDGVITAQLTLGADTLDAIAVTGQLAGQARAINRQRAAANVTTIVAAEEIGQFPDQNLGEALQRLPGLQLQRDQGEGRFVSIRGLNSNLNSISINGMRVPSAEADERQVALDVIPSDLIAGIEVDKAITPDMDGDAIGGNIEVRTLNAFDRDGRGGNVRIEGGYNDLRDAWSPKVGGTVSDVFSVGGGKDNLGIAVGASFEDRELGSDNNETDGAWIAAADGRVPPQIEQRDYIVDRKRQGLAVNVDFRPDANSEYYVRTLMTEFEDDEIRRRNQFTFEDAFEDGDVELLGDTSGRGNNIEVGRDIKLRKETQSIFSLMSGGENRVDDWTFDYQLGYAKATEKEPDRVDAEFLATGNGFDETFNSVAYRTVDGGKKYRMSGPDAMYDPASYQLAEVVVEDNETEEEEWSLALNIKKDTTFGDYPGFIKFGIKARVREKYADYTVYEYDEDDFGVVSMTDYTSTNFDYPFDRFGPAVSTRLGDFVANNRANWTYDEDVFIEDSQAADYSAEEDIYATYLMASADFDKLRVLGGVRVEYTDYSATGNEFTENDNTGELTVSGVQDDNSYVDILPGVHLRYELSPRSVLRGSVTRSIARPTFSDIAPYVVRKVDGGEEEFEAGNPDLDPYRSTNLDLMYAFYPRGSSAAYSIGAFYKDIQDYVVEADVAGTDFNARARAANEYITAVNGGDATVMGVELSAYQHLDFLPSPFDGMLVSANYTFTDTEASLEGRDGDIPLPQSSENTANFALGYEKYGLSLRAAVTYRDKYLDEVNDVEDSSADRYADSRYQVDLKGAYDVSKHFQIYAEAINITDEPFYAYFDQKRYNSQYDEFGPTYKVGANWRF
ncbi:MULTISPECIES: TonB-dependent receptor [unclassified Ectothiorhodospira]|uniref:TonB-dependent receptor n=1 Tax=unclassified Ectothiorhodospira TaxID=2684909 RepID=UPI001EE7F7D4|nr:MULTISPECIES: TonB-dependent receptor [unclassified Ectothiorhodospira]MCG5515581.1 TonB-dependent receptor [Ectothiorhodospira sp. 9100]MCG5518740.1 TonB-dependent receptor [Ectothiorhodospira sp. 9905]